jgi:hypothetical protein
LSSFAINNTRSNSSGTKTFDKIYSFPVFQLKRFGQNQHLSLLVVLILTNVLLLPPNEPEFTTTGLSVTTRAPIILNCLMVLCFGVIHSQHITFIFYLGNYNIAEIIVPLDNTVPLGILELVTLVPFSVDKIEAKLSKLLSKVGLTSRQLNILPNALLPLDTNPPAWSKTVARIKSALTLTLT